MEYASSARYDRRYAAVLEASPSVSEPVMVEVSFYRALSLDSLGRKAEAVRVYRRVLRSASRLSMGEFVIKAEAALEAIDRGEPMAPPPIHQHREGTSDVRAGLSTLRGEVGV